jgi:hypothetical protein
VEIAKVYLRTVQTGKPQFGVFQFGINNSTTPFRVEGGVWPLLGPSGDIEQAIALQDYSGF